MFSAFLTVFLYIIYNFVHNFGRDCDHGQHSTQNGVPTQFMCMCVYIIQTYIILLAHLCSFQNNFHCVFARFVFLSPPGIAAQKKLVGFICCFLAFLHPSPTAKDGCPRTSGSRPVARPSWCSYCWGTSSSPRVLLIIGVSNPSRYPL